jgi:hypothetical protein
MYFFIVCLIILPVVHTMYHQEINSQFQQYQRNGLAGFQNVAFLKNLKIANGQINSNASRNITSPKSFRLWYTPPVAKNMSLNTMKLDKMNSFVEFRVI